MHKVGTLEVMVRGKTSHGLVSSQRGILATGGLGVGMLYMPTPECPTARSLLLTAIRAASQIHDLLSFRFGNDVRRKIGIHHFAHG